MWIHQDSLCGSTRINHVDLWLSKAISGNISGYLWPSRSIFGYPWLYPAISGYLRLSWTIFGLSQVISGYLWLYLAISGYICVSGAIWQDLVRFYNSEASWWQTDRQTWPIPRGARAPKNYRRVKEFLFWIWGYGIHKNHHKFGWICWFWFWKRCNVAWDMSGKLKQKKS